ncbi:MAG: histidine--tRNA ligase [Puniceicoccales bacterium]|nr:histidine--tRNA ligase [Puniceicoccales bacterium]
MCAYQPLLGFRDFYPDDQRILNYMFDTIRKTALTFGFEEYSSPVLEPIELLTAKSGSEIVEQLFNFMDKGGRHVALRPEMTPVVARMVGQRINAMKKPIKWFNIAENFRYERPQKGRLRSFFQFNIDIFGESDYRADAEIILLTIAIMRNFGLCDFIVRLSDRHLWSLFLSATGVKECDIGNILCVIDKIDREGEEKTSAALRGIYPNLNSLYDFIVEFKSVRSVGALIEFFKTHNLFEFSGISERIDDLSALIGVLTDAGVDKYVSIDFGIVRGLAYYTGFVFEFFDSGLSSRALAGGGRYDSLTEKLGYCSIPAVGLAIGDVTLCDLLMEKKLLPHLEKVMNCFLIFDEISREYALKLANKLRHRWFSVEYCLHNISFSKQFKLAAQSGAKFALICGETEYADGVIKVKNLFSGDESTVTEADVSEILKHD